MVRIEVPDDFDSGYISVAGRKDFSYGTADVNTDAVAHARDLSIREDDDGTRYLGCSDHYADEVAEFLGVEPPVQDDEDAEPETVTDEVPTADLIDMGECPWCDDYEGDGVPQHASAAHPDEWTEYKEAGE